MAHRVSPAFRRCDLCGRELELSAQRPGWDVVRVAGVAFWRCPDCWRAGRREPLPGVVDEPDDARPWIDG